MEKKKLIHDRTTVYNIGYHIVWSTKYRRKVLKEQIEKSLKEIFLFMKHPELKKKLWGGNLWNLSTYIETIGHISEDTSRLVEARISCILALRCLVF